MNEKYEELETKLEEVIEKMKDDKKDVSEIITLYREGQELLKKLETSLNNLKEEIVKASEEE